MPQTKNTLSTKKPSAATVRAELALRIVALDPTQRAQCDQVVDTFLKHFHPRGTEERDLIRVMGHAEWLRRRIDQIENEILTAHAKELEHLEPVARRQQTLLDYYSSPTADYLLRCQDRLAKIHSKILNHRKLAASGKRLVYTELIRKFVIHLKAFEARHEGAAPEDVNQLIFRQALR